MPEKKFKDLIINYSHVMAFLILNGYLPQDQKYLPRTTQLYIANKRCQLKKKPIDKKIQYKLAYEDYIELREYLNSHKNGFETHINSVLPAVKTNLCMIYQNWSYGNIQCNISTGFNQAAQTVYPSCTIKDMINQFLKMDTGVQETKDKKERSLKKQVEFVKLELTDQYYQFHTIDNIENIYANICQDDTLKNESKNNHIRTLKEFVDYASNRNDYPCISKTLKMLKKTPRNKQNKHLPYRDEHLTKIFDPAYDFFKTPNKKKPLDVLDNFFICLIGLYTGSRVTAAITLQYKNVFSIKDETGNLLPCISFTAEENTKNSDRTKRLKNAATERTIPIHPQLLDLGFVKYVEKKKILKKASDDDYIFPICQTKGNKLNNKYWDRELSEFFKKIGVKAQNSDGYDFHSFRKTLANALLNIKTDHAHINAIIGWEGKDTLEEYYANVPLCEMYKDLKALNYDCLESHFKQWKPTILKLIGDMKV